VPRQITYRVSCPTCGSWAQLRVAEPFGGIQTEPVIVMFSCPEQTDEDHQPPTDEALIKLLPSHMDLPPL
jgi:hypothetical protein